MPLLLRRLWRTFGWWGLCGALVALAGLGVVAAGWSTESTAVNLLRPGLLLAVGLLMATLSWGRYERSALTRPYQEVLGPLLDSRDEYCLLLRPFGSDGEVTVRQLRPGRRGWRPIFAVVPNVTLEQVVAMAVRKRLRLRTLAMVDHKRELAPPGPEYLRAPHSEWQSAADDLIRRAHTIAIVIPPGQDLRRALDWELGRIVRYRRQHRVLLVLPPADVRRHEIDRLRRQAGVLLAALHGSGVLAEVDAAEAAAQEAQLTPDTMVIKIAREPSGLGVQWWYAQARRFRRIGTHNYLDAIGDAVAATELELAGLDFAARYRVPPRQPRVTSRVPNNAK